MNLIYDQFDNFKFNFQKQEGPWDAWDELAIFSFLVLETLLANLDSLQHHVHYKLLNVGSLSVNVSASTGTGRSEFVNTGELSGSTFLHDGPHKLIKTGIFVLFMHITLISCFVFL